MGTTVKRRLALLGALPPDPRSLALWRPTPVKKKQAGRPRSVSGLLAYSRPAGARVALLRNPILSTARRGIAKKVRSVQPQITPGGEDPMPRGKTDERTFLFQANSGHFYCVPTRGKDCDLMFDIRSWLQDDTQLKGGE